MAEKDIAQVGYHFKFSLRENTNIRNIINRVYSIVKKENIQDRKHHFTYGWADNPLSVLDHFYEQKSLPPSKRCIENGDYVVLFHDRDSGAFGHAIWDNEDNDPSYKQGTYRME